MHMVFKYMQISISLKKRNVRECSSLVTCQKTLPASSRKNRHLWTRWGWCELYVSEGTWVAASKIQHACSLTQMVYFEESIL